MSEVTDEFSRIEGHDRPVSVLVRSLARDRLHHAYLFVGQSGIGKRLVALTLAKAINCLSGVQGVACGTCTSCKRIAAGQHPDVIVIEPDKSKARWMIKIEKIRALGPQVAFKPYMGRRRVILIDHADTMMAEGANALLKTLEEPSGETLFVLVTASPSSLLPTIISRCQLLRFAPLPRETVKRLLVARDVDSERATVISGYADGSLARGIELSEQGALEARRALIERITEARDVGPIEIFKIASDVARVGHAQLRVLLDSLLLFYRDVAIVSAGASTDRVINTDILPEIESLASHLTTEEVLGHIERVAAAQGALQSYVDVKLLLEQLLFDAAAPPALKH